MLGWQRYDDGGRAGREDRYQGGGGNAVFLTRTEVAVEDRHIKTRTIEDANDNENGAMVEMEVEKWRGESGW